MVKLNRRVTIRAWGFAQDEIGGLIKAETGAWEMWANVEDRSGRNFRDHNQEVWDYDYKITVRYEDGRVIGSNNTIDYNGYLLKINSLSVSNEAFHKYAVLRCSAVDDNTATGGGGAVTPLPQIAFYNYSGIGGEDSFTALNGKQIFGATKDGITYKIIYLGTPSGKEVLFSGGVFTWSTTFEPGEIAIIQYIN